MSPSPSPEPKNENLYKRLGLKDNVPSEQIRKTFFKVVKIFPPEKDKGNYILIREAFDILKNPVSRNEYDTKNKFGAELEKLENVLKEYEDAEDLDGQIRIMKRILNFAPKLGLYRNKLGLAFMEQEQFGYAYQQFNKAYLTDESNPVYILNMGHAQESKDKYSDAEKLFQQAWDLDLEDYSPPRALASLYFYKLGRKKKAHNTLEKAIDADGILDFQDFFCIFDKVHFYSLDNNENGLKSELKRIITVASNKEEKEFAAYMLWQNGSQIFDLKIFDIALTFLKTAHTLLPRDEQIKTFYNECKKQVKLIKNLNKAMDDKQIHDLTKELIRLEAGRYYGEIENNEFRENFKKLTEILIHLMDIDPDSYDIKESMEYIKTKYNNIYELNANLYNKIINHPSPTNYREKCPHCRDFVKVRIYAYDTYECPHCWKKIKYSSSGFTKGGFFSLFD